MEKYVLMILSVIVLILLFSFFNIGETDEEKIIGFAENVHESTNGFTFNIVTEDQLSIKSYSSQKPDSSIHRFIGDYSDDGSIFFVCNIEDL